MSRAATRIGLWLLALVACAVVISRATFVADLSSFLPRAPTERQRLLVEQLRDGALSRTVLVGIDGADAAARAAISRRLGEALRQDGAFTAVANGDPAALGRDRALLFANRYLLSPAVDARRFTVEGLREAVEGTLALLASPLGVAMREAVPRDPTGEMAALVDVFVPASGPRLEGGAWATADGQRALLVARTRAAATDIDGQAAAIASIERAFAAAVAQGGAQAAGARLVMTGPGVFSVKSRALIEGEVVRLGALGTALVAGVLLWAYRSPLPLVLGLVPVFTGAVVGIAAVALGNGVVHGMTLGFGTTLIGEAVDYSIYYFLQNRTQGASGVDPSTFWSTIVLGTATSIAGFSALLLSSLPGLSQLGLYSIAGLVAAALVTRHVLPWLVPAHVRVRDFTGFGRRLLVLVARARGLRLPLLVLCAAAAAVLATRPFDLWDRDLASLNPIGAKDRALDAALRAGLGAADARFVAVVSAPGEDEALERAERVGRKLDALVQSGKLAGYESAARYLPSRATQEARRAALPTAEALRDRLGRALAGLPLRPARLEPFVADVAQARERAILTRADFRGTSVDLALDGLLFQDASGRWTALLGLRPPPAGLDRAMLEQALAGTGALLLDVKAEADSLYAGYLEQAAWLGVAGVFAVCAILAIALRSARRTARIVVPLLAAVLLVAAGYAALGTRMGIPHLVGLTLVVAIGSNYALFVDGMARRSAEANASTLASLALANFTTVASFGLLGTSSIPVIDAIGATVACGTAVALACSAAFAARSVDAAPAVA